MRNYQTICRNLFKDLDSRTKDVLEKRFGLAGSDKRTLESIGKDYGITRERARQIEGVGLNKIEDISKNKLGGVFQEFSRYLKKQGGLKKEDLLLAEFGGQKLQNEVFLILALSKQFKRYPETKDFYPFWIIDKDSMKKAKVLISSFIKELKQTRKPKSLSNNISYIEISKDIMKGPQGFYGLKEWPEINLRFVKDKAYLVFTKEKKPLHFIKVAELIKDLNFSEREKSGSQAQTIHNELIKDSRFVLVGRGLYALKEWGYTPGIVKEVISKTLKESAKPLSKKEIIGKVLLQRQVKRNTILLNLQDKNYFLKDSKDRYTIKEA